MSVVVLRRGLQTTLQAAPRTGQRHLGVPAAGPADGLSLALANRLVGNGARVPGLEITLQGPRLLFDTAAVAAVVGADARVTLNGNVIPQHESRALRPGDVFDVGALRTGARCYLAVAGGFAGRESFGSVSTYLPAALGGIEGRALEEGDRLRLCDPDAAPEPLETPARFRAVVPERIALRACDAAESGLLDEAQRGRLFGGQWRVGYRADRMGLELSGPGLALPPQPRMASSPVFPGCLQYPGSGTPFLLSVDAQTTGGYPRLLQVTRGDRHLIGQLRPGARLRFLPRTPDEAADELRAKLAYYSDWLPDLAAVL